MNPVFTTQRAFELLVLVQPIVLYAMLLGMYPLNTQLLTVSLNMILSNASENGERGLPDDIVIA